MAQYPKLGGLRCSPLNAALDFVKRKVIDMHLEISRFGPIEDCNVEITDAMFLIGPQSSGKSTISKMVFFFLLVRDEYIQYIIDASNSNQNERKIVGGFAKQLRRRFIEFWGPAPQNKDLCIRFHYKKDVSIELKLDRTGRYIDPILSNELRKELIKDYGLISRVNGTFATKSTLFNTLDLIEGDRNKQKSYSELISSAKVFFNFEEELLFIPAGRSLLSTLSEQLQYIHPHSLDYPLRSFVDRINRTKSSFGKSLENIISDRKALSDTKFNISVANRVAKLIKKILKGDYIHDHEGGKLYLNDKRTYTKINFASSGQQESIWILLTLFSIVLEKAKVRIFIEEPEAHLFPEAQNDMVEVITLLKNTTRSKFIITTHSPYIITSFNNHIYANEVGKKHEGQVSKIIPKDMWLDYKITSGFFVKDGKLTSLCDDSLMMLKTELVDTASEKSNEVYDKLFEMEFGNV